MSLSIFCQPFNIAIAEERVSHSNPPMNYSAKDFSWHERKLNYITPPEKGKNPWVVLNGNHIKFKVGGTYYITASAPASQCSEHKIALFDASTKEIVLNGTSEYSPSVIISKDTITGIVTRSYLVGIIKVGGSGGEYYLSHYIHHNSGGQFSFGIPADTKNGKDEEVYAQVCIQKLNPVISDEE